jgi:hypothetical protein
MIAIAESGNYQIAMVKVFSQKQGTESNQIDDIT